MHTKNLQSFVQAVVKSIRRATPKRYNADEKIRIVLEGLRSEYKVTELCRREIIAQGVYHEWSKEFAEAGKRRLAGDIQRSNSANSTNATTKKRSINDEIIW